MVWHLAILRCGCISIRPRRGEHAHRRWGIIVRVVVVGICGEERFVSEEKPDVGCFGIIVLLCSAFLLGVALSNIATQYMMLNHIRNDAIKAGAGRYVCDPETGKVTFEWVTK